MRKEKIKEIGIDLLADIFAGFLIAIGVYNLASLAQFPMSGISGVALIFYQLFGLPIGTMTIVLNIPIVLLTWRTLGRTFFLKSVKTMAISSFIMDVIAPLLPMFEGDRMLSALCCGVLTGAGYALIFMRDSSTGGSDFIVLAVRAKRPHLSIGTITFIMDLFIIAAGTALVSQDFESMIYGLIIAFLAATVTDKIMYGSHQGKVALVVTDHAEEICTSIDETFDRGSTILKGIGSYTHKEKGVVMCACNTKQMYGLRRLIKKVDPKSFLVIMDSSDVVGEGFQEE
ncbi:MAG: YitT family protein [Lachnospiraceae bacterium]|nr:YitT family protein [Lachnospiraceae bacterium]